MGAPQLHWVNNLVRGNLAVMAAPRPHDRLDEVLLGWQSEGVEIVVSLVERQELPGLMEAEQDLCAEFGLEFVWFPVRDKTVPPSHDPVLRLCRQLAGEIYKGRSIAIHCRAGIGRSPLLAACILMHLGVDGATALDMIAEARGVEVPETEAQRQWILGLDQYIHPEARRGR